MIRILGAIGMDAPPEVLDQVMRQEGYMRVDETALPQDYPFIEYERCDLYVVNTDGPFPTILVFAGWERAFQRAVGISRLTQGPVMGVRCDGRGPDCLKVYDQGGISLKVGIDDDDETGLLARSAGPDEVREALIRRWGLQLSGKADDPWSVALALGVPDIERADQAGALRCVKKLV